MERRVGGTVKLRHEHSGSVASQLHQQCQLAAHGQNRTMVWMSDRATHAGHHPVTASAMSPRATCDATVGRSIPWQPKVKRRPADDVHWVGQLRITLGGRCNSCLNIDGSSTMYLNNELVVNNNVLRGMQ